MTWTCKCGRVMGSPEVEADKPAELSEEECAAAECGRKANESIGWVPLADSALGERDRKFMLTFWTAARAPLEAELKTLRERVREPYKQVDQSIELSKRLERREVDRREHPMSAIEPAASPPGEVSTENLQKEMHNQNPDEQLGQCDLELVEAAEADILAAVEREAAKDKSRIAELNRALILAANQESQRISKIAGERDAALAEVERLRKAYKSRDEGRMVMSLVGLEREVERLKAVRTAWQAASGRIVEYLEPGEKCAMATPEETERAVRETVERLKGELERAKEARRCPADGMSDEGTNEQERKS